MFPNMVLPETFCPFLIPAKNAKEARDKALKYLQQKLAELKIQYIVQGITTVLEINPESGTEHGCTLFEENETLLGYSLS